MDIPAISIKRGHHRCVCVCAVWVRDVWWCRVAAERIAKDPGDWADWISIVVIVSPGPAWCTGRKLGGHHSASKLKIGA